ncbi:PglD-related sugar-binding protein [Roseococcus microcysteis]|uniref:PglD-related sugar-binding protein n=1 Tax=Roseococcus microcysteis TaxID=2771361 RepID=UPI00168A4D4B|nr:hypothetical protein [Roseococcus microcysteis]
MRLLVLGAGGHALVVLEALDALGWAVAGLLDDRATAPILGRPVLGPLASLGAHGATRAVIALGDNATRLEWGQAARRAGLALPALVHPAALVSPSARVAEGAQVMARASVGPLAVIGALALVNTAAVVEHECVVEGGPMSRRAPCSAARCAWGPARWSARARWWRRGAAWGLVPWPARGRRWCATWRRARWWPECRPGRSASDRHR